MGRGVGKTETALIVLVTPARSKNCSAPVTRGFAIQTSNRKSKAS